jgi:hypothetical protein
MLFEGPSVAGNLTEYREEVLDKVSFNGQVIYLEKILNDRFNPDMISPIYIIDVANVEFVYISNKAEGYDPVYLSNKAESLTPLYVSNKSEIYGSLDFIIMVPSAIYTNLQLNNNNGISNMTALVNYYKIAGKRFTIQSY